MVFIFLFSDSLHSVEQVLGAFTSLELIQMLSFFMAEQYSIVCMYHNFFTHSSVYGHLGCFHVLVIVNVAAVNIRIHVSLSILVSSGYMLRSGTAGSYGGSIPIFKESPYHLP